VDDDVRLLVVGCKGWGKQAFSQIMDAPGYPVERVVFADYVSDPELQVLYAHVLALAWPSLLEGFGLPLLEAMSMGCPVVAANNSAMPEVVGSGGLLVEGWSQLEWKQAVRQVLHSRSLFSQAARQAAACHSMERPCSELMTHLRVWGGDLQEKVPSHGSH
jgi:glycosyltransferase involved in cell wall biosynthesis